MFFAMNRFKITAGSEEEFENLWKNRDSRLHEMPGFVEFKLLRGETNKNQSYTLYVSHSTWEREDDFRGWTKSENFRNSHKDAGQNKAIYAGPPVLETFNTLIGD